MAEKSSVQMYATLFFKNDLNHNNISTIAFDCIRETVPTSCHTEISLISTAIRRTLLILK